MKLLAAALQQLDRLKRRGLDAGSLQFRLTLGITSASLLGVIGIGTFTTWEMRQMLVDQHKHQLQEVAETLPQRIEGLATGAPLSRSPFLQQIQPQIQPAIDSFSSPNQWLWIKTADRQVLAQSDNLSTFPMSANQLSPTDVAPQPEVVFIGDRYLVMCSGPLQVQGRTIGHLYLARDITHDYTVLTTLVKSLMVGMALAIAATGLFVSLWIWRSLSPLRQVNRLARANAQFSPSENPDWDLDQVPSEVKELVLAFGSLSSRLSAAGDQQRQLTNSMSHELRTSLSLVYGYLQSTLRRGDNLTEPQRESLEVAVSETERTIQLLKDLLDLARANSGTLELEMKPLILNDLIAEFASDDRIKIEVTPHSTSGIATETARNFELVDSKLVDSELVNSELIIVSVDRHQLKRALSELVTNALRYSNETMLVTLRLHQDSDWAWLEVIDRGNGIAPEHLPHIFEPFYRTDDSRTRSTGGIGLGLAIAHSLITAMNGQLTVRSTPEFGSTFTIKLPIIS